MKTVALSIFTSATLISASALAQDAQPTPPPPTPAPAPVAAPAPAHVTELSDHEMMVHHLAVGYMGASQIPIAQATLNGGGLAVTEGNVTAPYIGVRYWLSNLLGLDLGLGFAYAGGSTTTTFTPPGGTTTSTSVDRPSVLGFGIHGGVPLALAYSKHFTFQIVPELNFGYATSTIKSVTPPGQPAIPDINQNGLRFDVGARVGTELHFGFIGVPQLALQASIALAFRYTSVKASLSDGTASQSITGPSFGTSVQDAPWAIFTNNIAALYYF